MPDGSDSAKIPAQDAHDIDRALSSLSAEVEAALQFPQELPDLLRQ
ncbi:hypothetical protein [Streptomyces xantholiticus]|nr:hypothetical protein [Streptomyces xantholiticus]